MAFAPSDLVKRLLRPLQSRLLPLTSALTLIPTLTLKPTLILPLTGGRIEYPVSSIGWAGGNSEFRIPNFHGRIQHRGDGHGDGFNLIE